jgi:hypothetical protein
LAATFALVRVRGLVALSYAPVQTMLSASYAPVCVAVMPYVIGSTSFLNIVTAEPITYGMNPAQVSAYDALNIVWTGAYERATNPLTRTKANVAAKNAARAAIVAMSADLARIIDGTPTVTDAQKIELGLNVRKAPVPVPAPTEAPAVDLGSVVNRTVNVHIHDSAASSKRGKPAGAVAAWVYTYVGQNYPTDPAAWTFERSTTKAKFQITFPDTVAGGQSVWIRAAWINAKQEAGPLSVPVTTNLQGGGSAVQVQELKIAA